MSDARNGRIAAGLVGLRSPLGCIELAADELRRDGATPGARALAERIAGAVAEVDAGLDGALRALLGAGAGATRAADPDCRGALARAWSRFGPALEALGVETTLRLPETPLPGDAEALRRSAVALVRDALAAGIAGRGLTLSLDDEGARYGVGLLGPDPCAFESARALALRLGAELEPTPSGQGATLWLRREVDP